MTLMLGNLLARWAAERRFELAPPQTATKIGWPPRPSVEEVPVRSGRLESVHGANTVNISVMPHQFQIA